MKNLTRICWGAIWNQKTKLGGAQHHIIHHNYLPALFTTKKEAKEFIKHHYGYIAKRKDLRHEPHGWRMPKIVKLKISVTK